MSLTAAQYAKKAYDALLREGRTIEVTVYADSYDPATGLNSRTSTDYSVVASPLLEYSRQSFAGAELEAQTLVKVGDMFVIVPNHSLAFSPSILNIVSVDSVKWLVVGVKEYNHKIGTVAYELQLRRASN